MDQVIEASVLERLLRRDRAVTLLALAAVSLLAWSYLLFGMEMETPSMSMSMSMSMPGMAMSMSPAWTPSYFVLMLTMWGIMMVAMMLPSAAPMILLFSTIERRRGAGSPLAATATFAAAYVVVWVGFSVAAALLQWQFDRLALLSPDMASTNAAVTASLLIGVGLYQFTPWKHACLRGCRSPLEFISRYWGSGPFGLGLRHGLYCLGCCFMLMLLLFVAGIMNLLWVALIAAFVLAEKIAPRGAWLSYGAGAALVGLGVWTLFAHGIA